MKVTQDRTVWALGGAVLAAVTASLCCILPIVAVIAGVSGFAASQFFEQWRPYLLAVTFGLLALGFYLSYRRAPKEACEPGSVCARPGFGKWNRRVLWLATVFVALFATFPYYSGWVVRAVAGTGQPAANVSQVATQHVVLTIEGMDCPACAGLLQNNLRQIPGVHRAEVNFQDKRATLDYDPHAVEPSQFAQVVAEAGFKVTDTAAKGE
ncbi:MAG: cation transporter [Betaproteobacteria bacterium]|nr:cation transporter [Betaproteobacteria bacterium]